MMQKDELCVFRKVVKKHKLYHLYKKGLLNCVRDFLNHGYITTYPTLIGKSFCENPKQFITNIHKYLTPFVIEERNRQESIRVIVSVVFRDFFISDAIKDNIVKEIYKELYATI